MDKPTVTTELSRDLNLFHLTMMGLGMMIGAGVFLGIGNAIRIAGPGGLLLTFALNTLLALFTAMSYAELSSAIPRAGGAYNFARIGFGGGTSFLAGWMEWFASSVAGSMYAITFAIYTVRYLEQLRFLSWLAVPTLLVKPVANPETALSLAWNTNKIGRSRPSQIKLLHMVPVPDQVALSDAEKYMTEGREGIVEAMLYLVQRFPVTTTFRYCRNIARGITSAVREKKIGLLIMGWHGEGRDRRFRIGSTLDPVISRAPCDIVILKDCGSKTFRNILVPLFGEANDAFALDTAERMAQEKDGVITAMPVRGAANKQRGMWSEERYLDRLLRRVEHQPVKVQLKGTPPLDPVKAVLQEAEKHDLVVLGLAGSFLRQVGVPTVAEQIARQYVTPLVLAKASKGLSAFTKKWI